MIVPSTGLPTTPTVDATTVQPSTAAHEPAVSSTDVLITPQQVLFGSAAALAARRDGIGARLVATARRVFAPPPHAPDRRPRHYPRQHGFLDDALMAREMGRL